MKTIVQITVALLIASISLAQQAYRIPFASSGNTIELAVENASPQMVNGVKVTAQDIPSWVHVTQTEQVLDQLKPSKEKSVVFTFAIDKTAPVNKEQHLTFVVGTPSGETWMKEITISVTPPDRFELLQNYPNPFNPITKIEYILPKESKVKLVVYNALGQEVKTLVDEIQDPGYKVLSFDAGYLSSGVYFYRLRADNFNEIKSMLLIR